MLYQTSRHMDLINCSERVIAFHFHQWLQKFKQFALLMFRQKDTANNSLLFSQKFFLEVVYDNLIYLH